MAFITHLYISRVKLLLPLLLMLGLGLPPCAYADGFTIRSVATHLQDKVYLLDANIDYQFSDAALEALRNGVEVIAYQAEVSPVGIALRRSLPVVC